MEARFFKRIIESPRSFGQILRKKRLSKKISLKEAAKRTMIRRHYLYYLETEQFKRLPPEPYGSYFVKRYAEFLGLESQKMVIWYQQEIHARNKDADRVQPPEEVRFSFLGLLRQRFRYFLLGGLAVLLLSSFLAYEVVGFTKGPYLKVVAPEQTQIVTQEPLFTVRGVADHEATVTLNGELLELESGVFEKEVVLKPGKNIFVLEAKDNLGKKTTQEIVIWRL